MPGACRRLVGEVFPFLIHHVASVRGPHPWVRVNLDTGHQDPADTSVHQRRVGRAGRGIMIATIIPVTKDRMPATCRGWFSHLPCGSPFSPHDSPEGSALFSSCLTSEETEAWVR